MINSAQQILVDTFHVAGTWLYKGFRGDLDEFFAFQIQSKLMLRLVFIRKFRDE